MTANTRNVLEDLRPPGGWYATAAAPAPPASSSSPTGPASAGPAPAGALATRWQEQAACRGLDPALFFPERGESLAAARAVCAGCPVRGECLDHALEKVEKFGVWGGTSERERRAIRRRRARVGRRSAA